MTTKSIQKLGKYDRFKGSLKKGKAFAGKHKKTLGAAAVITIAIAACSQYPPCAASAASIASQLRSAAQNHAKAFGKFMGEVKKAAEKGPKKVFEVTKNFLKSVKGKKPEVPTGGGGGKEGMSLFGKAKSGVVKGGTAAAGGLATLDKVQQNANLAKGLHSTASSFGGGNDGGPVQEPKKGNGKGKGKSKGKKQASRRRRRRRRKSRKSRKRPSRRKRKTRKRRRRRY